VEGRAIMGLSMGGHGALLLAAKHPDVFGSASSLSGILKLTNHPDSWHIPELLGPIAQNRAAWEKNSVYEIADRFKDSSVRLLFDFGTEDISTGAIADGRLLHQRLTQLQVPHIWREFGGGHSWEYWGAHLEEHLNFHQASTTDGIPDMNRWIRHYFTRIREFDDENALLAIRKPKKPTLALVGSSTMEGFPEELLSGFQVLDRGIASDTLGLGQRGISHRMESTIFDAQPDYIFFLNGQNDLAARNASGSPSIEQIVKKYESVVVQAKQRLPQSKIFIITCQSTRYKYANLAQPIRELNRQLAQMAARNGVGVVDLYSALLEKDGMVKDQFTRDGLHMSRPGYEACARMMKDAIARAQKSRGSELTKAVK
jgi:lysophospholipase L1-like esterase